MEDNRILIVVMKYEPYKRELGTLRKRYKYQLGPLAKRAAGEECHAAK
jgi:hypothetical protein